MSEEKITPTERVEHILKFAGLPVTAEEKEQLIEQEPYFEQMTQALRVTEVRYGEPATIYPALVRRTEYDPNLAKLKQLDALLFQSGYSEEVFAGLLPYVAAYFETMPVLREMELGEIKAATVMLGGGKR
jgi:hypothetical protein